jgi:hypothetical protein
MHVVGHRNRGHDRPCRRGIDFGKGVAKGDPSAQIAKLGAKEITDGAIIFRSGSKLYIVDGRPPAKTQ